MENNDWESEFWEKEEELNLSLDNENYRDLMRFALFYQTKGLEEALKLLPMERDVLPSTRLWSLGQGWNNYREVAKEAITSRIEESKKGKV